MPTDLFSRIGVVLGALVANSTLNGDLKAEAARLSQELQETPDNFAEMIEQRVQAAAESVGGRIEALEEGKRKSDAIVFSNANAKSLGVVDEVVEVSAEEREQLRDLFNGADPAKFDHDNDGAPGGDVPAAELRDKLKEALTEAKIPFAANAKTTTLQKLADEAGIVLGNDGAGTEEPPVTEPASQTGDPGA